jgi:glycosyltransferase 2 family protein
LLERVIDLTTLALLAAFAAILVDAPAWAVQLLALAAVAGAAVLAVLVVVGLTPLLTWLRARSGRRASTWLDRFLDALERFATGIGGKAQRRPVLQGIALSVVIWTVDSVFCWVIARSIGLDLNLATALLVVGIGALGTTIPSAPGYVGTYELAVASIARALGVAPDEALGFALLLHATTLLPVAIGGFVSLLALGYSNLAQLAGSVQAQDEGQRP